MAEGISQFALDHLYDSIVSPLSDLWNSKDAPLTENLVLPLVPIIYLVILANLNGMYWRAAKPHGHRIYNELGRLGRVAGVYRESWNIIRQFVYSAHFVLSFFAFLVPTVLLQLKVPRNQDACEAVLWRSLGCLLIAASSYACLHFHHKDTHGIQAMTPSKRTRVRILEGFWALVSLLAVLRIHTSTRRMIDKPYGGTSLYYMDFGRDLLILIITLGAWGVTMCVGADEREDSVSLLAEAFLERTECDRQTALDSVVQVTISESRKDSPEDQVGFLNGIWFSWLTPFIKLGNRRLFTAHDLWSLPPDVQGAVTYARFNKIWNDEIKKPIDKYTLVRALMKFAHPSLLYAACLKFTYDTFGMMSPAFLSLVVTYMTNAESKHPPSKWRGLFYVFLLSCTSALQTIFLHQYFKRQLTLGFRLRSAVSTAVYTKALTFDREALDPELAQKLSMGQLINLMSVDVQRIQDLMSYCHILWSAPYQLTITAVLLWYQLGAASIAGILTMALAIPLSQRISAKLKMKQKDLMQLKDTRVKLTQETFNGIRAVKLYAWEDAHMEKIDDARTKELNKLWSIQMTTVRYRAQTFGIPGVVAVVSFFFYSWYLGHPMTPATAFTALALFNNMRFPMNMLPNLVMQVSEVLVTLDRVQRFLLLKDVGMPEVQPLETSEPTLEMRHVVLSYTKATPILTDLNLLLRQGQLVAVIGRTGVGKSTLAQTAVGNMETKGGKMLIRGTQAYCPQTAWIQTGTVRDNILFGMPFDQARYQDVLESCALLDDLKVLPDGDETELGEKGVNLSGGQKQRIALARAVYRDADTYILDDILSAVDTHVADHLFRKVFRGLLRDKAILFVTHRYETLADVDEILFIHDGECQSFKSLAEAESNEAFIELAAEPNSSIGDYSTLSSEPDLPLIVTSATGATKAAEELISTANDTRPCPCDLTAHPSYRCLCDTSSADDESSSSSESDCGDGLVRSVPVVSTPECHKERQQLLSSMPTCCNKAKLHKLLHRVSREEFQKRCPGSRSSKTGSMEEVPVLGAGMGRARRNSLIEEERMEIGAVAAQVYKTYFQACGGGYWYGLMVALIVFTNQSVTVGSNFWLSYWSDRSAPDNPRGYVPASEGVLGYAIGVVGGVVSVVLAGLFVAIGTQRAAAYFHSEMLRSLLHATIRFFESTPVGRIVNRFSKDLYAIDEAIPNTLYQYCVQVMSVVFVLSVVIYVVPTLLLIIIPMCFVYQKIQVMYVTVARQLRRIDSVLRSPVFTHFGETIDGAMTIRPYRQNAYVRLIHLDRLDANLGAAYLWIITNRWLGTRLETMGTCLIALVALGCVMASGRLSAALSGLAISYSISVVNNLTWLVRISGDREANVIAVERVMEYMDERNCPHEDYKGLATLNTHEAPLLITGGNSDKSFGRIDFRDVGVRYRPGLPFAIRHVTISIQPGEKVGVVGRTGAGKSTFMSSLFRLVELREGEILMDGVNIAHLPVDELRRHCAIIPQDSTIFSGTIRSNLDPFSERTDEEVWIALEKACLKAFVEALPDKLLSHVREGGTNLSGGQRQLLCLARVCLRRARVLLLDEATSALDPNTDATIQQTIRKDFAHLTVVAIAHRIRTVLDYDKIIVMDKGEIAEYGTPGELLADPSSLFFGLTNSGA